MCRRPVGEPQGVCILGIDTLDVAAGQGLHDQHDGTGREDTANPAGDLDDFTCPACAFSIDCDLRHKERLERLDCQAP